jgi:hypothetical protein
MTLTIAANASPLNCRWIVPGSAHYKGDWSYAICVRNFRSERLVNASECSRCPRREEPDDVAERRAALAWNGVNCAE